MSKHFLSAKSKFLLGFCIFAAIACTVMHYKAYERRFFFQNMPEHAYYTKENLFFHIDNYPSFSMPLGFSYKYSTNIYGEVRSGYLICEDSIVYDVNCDFFTVSKFVLFDLKTNTSLPLEGTSIIPSISKITGMRNEYELQFLPGPKSEWQLGVERLIFKIDYLNGITDIRIVHYPDSTIEVDFKLSH
jgi:hypothetical protein